MNRIVLMLILLSIAVFVIADTSTEQSNKIEQNSTSNKQEKNNQLSEEPYAIAFNLKKISKLRKRITTSETEKILDTIPQFKVNADSLKIDSNLELHVYRVKPALYYKRYFMLYENGELVFWGFPSEFIKSDNSIYQKFGNFALDKLENDEDGLGNDKDANQLWREKDNKEKERIRRDNGYY